MLVEIKEGFVPEVNVNVCGLNNIFHEGNIKSGL